MYIGSVSKLTGASRKAIHHYEKLGLLQDVVRSGSYRIYSHHHVVIVSMIKRAQTLGFRLADIAPLVLAKHSDNRFPLAIANDAIEQKRERIRLDIEKARQLDVDLLALKKELLALFASS